MSADDSQKWIIAFKTVRGMINHRFVSVFGGGKLMEQLKAAIDKAVVEDMLDLDLPVMVGNAKYEPIVMHIHRKDEDPSWIIMDDTSDPLHIALTTACLVCGAIKSK